MTAPRGAPPQGPGSSPERETARSARPTTLRSRYEDAVRALQQQVAAMRRDSLSAEAIARAVHAERRRLAVHFKDLTPEPDRTRIRERTLQVYGRPDGPSIAFLRAQGKSWEAIIESATRPGRMDEGRSDPADDRD
ncbi:hypothetical protein [Methylobacterium oryzisoli]|uniref:hypothetical protein n=1 Tax=Methylobacterium oryzisoli TaxID=3385502 RepID=UPI003892B9E3